MSYKPPSGWTIEWGKDGFKAGSYHKGLWARWFKLDIYLCRVLRPVPRWPDRTPIKHYDWSKFPRRLVEKLETKNPEPSLVKELVYDYKYTATNPWKGNYWWVLDSRIRIPCVFLSLFGRFYVGIKTYNAEAELPTPYNPRTNSGGDITWMPRGTVTGRYGAPSITMRSKRTDG